MQDAQLKSKGRPVVLRVSLTFWVPTLLPGGDEKQEPLVHWRLCNEAGNTFCPGITPSAMASTEQKNLKMQSWGAQAQSQTLYYMKKGKKTQREGSGGGPDPLSQPSAVSPTSQRCCCCCFPALRSVGPSLTTSPREATSSSAASDMPAHSIPWWGDWSVWATSSLKPQDTDLDKTKEAAQCKEPWLSERGWWVSGGGRVPCFSSFGPGVQSTACQCSLLCKPSWISQLDQGSSVTGGCQEQTLL